jgi:hypothetical protein
MYAVFTYINNTQFHSIYALISITHAMDVHAIMLQLLVLFEKCTKQVDVGHRGD